MGCRNSEDSSRSYFSFVRWVEVEPFLSMLFLGVKIIDREVDSNEWHYRKVASSRLSWLVANSVIFRLFMKGNFDAYVL